jgi:hypothetical protein
MEYESFVHLPYSSSFAFGKYLPVAQPPSRTAVNNANITQSDNLPVFMDFLSEASLGGK